MKFLPLRGGFETFPRRAVASGTWKCKIVLGTSLAMIALVYQVGGLCICDFFLPPPLTIIIRSIALSHHEPSSFGLRSRN